MDGRIRTSETLDTRGHRERGGLSTVHLFHTPGSSGATSKAVMPLGAVTIASGGDPPETCLNFVVKYRGQLNSNLDHPRYKRPLGADAKGV